MSFILTEKTTFSFVKTDSTAIKYAIDILYRDFNKVFSANIKKSDNADISIEMDGNIENAEQYILSVTARSIKIRCKDELAMIYGILHISREFLGIDDFWFWAEKEPQKKNRVVIDEGEYISPVQRVKYRGWFVNDEVCLIGWSETYPPSRSVWECVFETLLRLGGNMVIPGTDLPREGEHFDIATEMGFYITHHHAEPLGGEMFLRAYPNEEASYDTNPELFQKLWSDAIEKNKDKKIIWTLGFRGQGDAPFWHNDPKYVTPESRGEVIRKVIDKQYSMICEKVKDPVCAVYLYGEITELYDGGYLDIPNKFIKIWSDNGYGKMVTRRNGNHNVRTLSLPKDDGGSHGLYYHVTFHDLQASNHLTLLGNPPELVNDELDRAFNAGANEYLLLNCGNIRPHIYMLDLVSKKWANGEVNIDEFKSDFAKRYFGNEDANVIGCYNEYFKSTVKYGENEDDRAGDEFFYHPARNIIVNWAKKVPLGYSTGLIWATGEVSFSEQVDWFKQKCIVAVEDFEKLSIRCNDVYDKLTEDRKVFFKDNLWFQVKLCLSGAKGFVKLCEAYEYYEKEDYPRCFVVLTRAMREYAYGLEYMSESEHGKWKDFYSCDWLTNVQVTIDEINALRGYIRLLGDAPDYFRWFKGYIMPETERNIYLENTQRRTLGDDDLAEKLAAEFGMEI